MTEKKVYLYPVWIRLWHLVNALLILLLIITGISMLYSTPSATWIRFDVAVTIHNTSGVLLTISYLFFFLGNLFTTNWRHYVIQLPGMWTRLWKQFRYYAFGVFKKEECPFPIGSKRKFNPLQQFTYTGLMYFVVPVIMITGWAMMFPEVIIDQYLKIAGFKTTDVIHVTAALIVLIFLMIHLYFATMGKKPSTHYKAMLTGYHEDETG